MLEGSHAELLNSAEEEGRTLEVGKTDANGLPDCLRWPKDCQDKRKDEQSGEDTSRGKGGAKWGIERGSEEGEEPTFSEPDPSPFRLISGEEINSKGKNVNKPTAGGRKKGGVALTEKFSRGGIAEITCVIKGKGGGGTKNGMVTKPRIVKGGK